MKIDDLGEDQLVARLTKNLAASDRGVVGIGDDCAAMQATNGRDLLLFKTDCLLEGIHFLRTARPDQVGWKAVCRVLSDIAAMGGEPTEALVTAALPKDLELRYADGLYQGIRRAAEAHGVAIVGGETASSPKGIFLSVAMIGKVAPEHLKRRDGATAGDALYVTGRLGGSLASRHLTFSPRLEEGQWLGRRKSVTAMMDLSDGLGTDLPRLARASGVTFTVERASLPRHRGVTPDGAWSDGEDYELLIAVSRRGEKSLVRDWQKRFPRLQLSRIGELIAGTAAEGGEGYDHFRKAGTPT